MTSARASLISARTAACRPVEFRPLTFQQRTRGAGLGSLAMGAPKGQARRHHVDGAVEAASKKREAHSRRLTGTLQHQIHNRQAYRSTTSTRNIDMTNDREATTTTSMTTDDSRVRQRDLTDTSHRDNHRLRHLLLLRAARGRHRGENQTAVSGSKAPWSSPAALPPLLRGVLASWTRQSMASMAWSGSGESKRVT